MSALNEHLLPKGVTVIEVGFTADVIPAYPLPLLITSTEVIIPLVTFALILPNLPFPLIYSLLYKILATKLVCLMLIFMVLLCQNYFQ